MNERIKELARQCGAYHKDDEGEETKIAVLIGKEVEKFAELIVKECAETVEVYIHESLYNGLYERGYNDGRNASALLIKQHFGVEE